MQSTNDDAAAAYTAHRGFLIGACLGGIHAGFSLYWAAGGTWLVWTLGSSLLETFRGKEWLLILVAIVKLVAALAPVLLARRGWPADPLTRGISWLGALVLVLWGGLNTIVGNLVLAGLIGDPSGYDLPGMIGHAYLWDPIFLAWGIALAFGLRATRKRSTTSLR
ncbi:DUF3995 domain-containing protein [Paeniglutamicibacter cryotolerans]|uniref:Putative membrane protein n=1 Tax=Paeniglutamicibacter cryotolerans TaxID=670079 RepID=A0A839QRA4_9MICC|nr:DUF3995 domain-containing protein [Paeniglutamicibacter cryotolerans]MBB2997314.1 putative membrane protein [Paeniglutamicibacter cryotolerans]